MFEPELPISHCLLYDEDDDTPQQTRRRPNKKFDDESFGDRVRQREISYRPRTRWQDEFFNEPFIEDNE